MELIWRIEDWRLQKINEDDEDKFHLTKNVFGPCYKCNICTYTKSRNILLKIGNMQAIRKAHLSVETTWQMNNTMHLMHQRKNRRKQYLYEIWDCDCWVHCSRYERIQFEWAQWIQLQRLKFIYIYQQLRCWEIQHLRTLYLANYTIKQSIFSSTLLLFLKAFCVLKKSLVVLSCPEP